ncbi:MAG: hypothetical protein NZ951_07820 [Dehalococcoidia bacterium]|nr:hypothetical protein [Dehalococcoidia bacterium]MDW8119699.1 hypothetical protein [Chloroflexota bacterium]
MQSSPTIPTLPLGKFLVGAILLAMVASTVTIYAIQNPGSVQWPPGSPRHTAAPPRADIPLHADVVGWVLGPGNRVKGLVIAWSPPAQSAYALRIHLKDEAGALLASASCKVGASHGQGRQDTVVFPFGPPRHTVSQVVISIVETAPGPTTCS